MIKFHLGCQLNYKIEEFSTFFFNIRAENNEYQTVIQETLKLEPALEIKEYSSAWNQSRCFQVNVPAGNFAVSYDAIVEVMPVYHHPETLREIPPAELPLEVLPYLLPSRYCQSDQLVQLAQSEFGNLQPDYSRVTAICNWIYEKVTYLSGSTNSQTSAYDTAIERAGVCRDFAHLGIAFCRALNIPARFVAGYAWGLEPPDFHAYFEAYLGGRWYLFDATRLVPLQGTVRIGTGRDATDVSFATMFGSLAMENMQVFIEPASDQASNIQQVLAPKIEAIATI